MSDNASSTGLHDSLSPTAHVFLEGLAAGELRFQKCDECGTFRHPPSSVCAKCGSWAWSTIVSKGKGKIYSWVIPRRPALPSPPTATGQTVVLVELEKGVRVLGHFEGETPPDFGDIVEASVRRFGEMLVPLFRRVRDA